MKHFLFGSNISSILPFNNIEADTARLNENRGGFSLSGAQTKYSVVVRNGTFALTEPGEQGTFILKPVLSDFERRIDSPANEYLTMQIARQIFHIEIAECELCQFENGEPAYITKRFDIAPDGTKIQQEDFASLAGITRESHGPDYKYNALSYEEIGNLIRRYLPAWRVEMVKFFSLILFNFLFSNGDAHLKNFSVLKTVDGDYRLSPAYDLIDTHLHLPNDSIFALSKGLFADGRSFPRGIGNKDFREFGKTLGIPDKVVLGELDRFCADYPNIENMINDSFLSEESKSLYYTHYYTRLNSFLKD